MHITALIVGDLFIAWIGNGIGTALVAILIHFTRFEAGILGRIEEIVIPKLADSPVSLTILGLFCALFVAFAVFMGIHLSEHNESFYFGFSSLLLFSVDLNISLQICIICHIFLF